MQKKRKRTVVVATCLVCGHVARMVLRNVGNAVKLVCKQPGCKMPKEVK